MGKRINPQRRGKFYVARRQKCGGSRIEGRMSKVEGRRSKVEDSLTCDGAIFYPLSILNPQSPILNPQSPILNPRSSRLIAGLALLFLHELIGREFGIDLHLA